MYSYKIITSALVFSFLCMDAYADPIRFMGVGWDMSVDEIKTTLESRGLTCERFKFNNGDAMGCNKNQDSFVSEFILHLNPFGTSAKMSFSSSMFNGDNVLTNEIRNRLEETTGLNLQATPSQSYPSNPYNQIFMYCAVGTDKDELCLEPNPMLIESLISGQHRGGVVVIYKHLFGTEDQELAF